MLSPKTVLAASLVLSSVATANPLDRREASPGLIEDLLNIALTPITNLISNVLSGSITAIDNTISSKPLTCSLSIFAPDKCCVWWDVSAELTRRFKESNGTCNDNARAAIRMGFHDAGAWDKNSPSGGADGSLLMDFGEINRPENNGLQSIRTLLRGVQSQYRVGYADLVQYAHNHASISCPKGPRVRTFIGRQDATRAPPDGLLPDVHDDPDKIIALFENKGIDAHDLAALLGAHATARQRFVDTRPVAVNKPLDTTIGVWDVEFYNDTLNNAAGSSATQKVFVLPSDKALSKHPKLTDEWKSFVGDQQHWNEDYAKAYVRLSLLGVKNLQNLVDCTKTLPPSRKTFP
ncbi:hypothetical protein IAQ61_010554 [Plenodomus lingam]|uniref:uncharacterized protein n=1 Tax=Leptosphaeria maculans TaxID=5022 RepID=UPI003330A2F5|nr:hypothetical protein IAQ61_010554 [Plenodomus lingam]